MHDMLVKLYELPDASIHRAKMAERGVVLRAARAYELGPVRRWITEHFAEGWADEVQACFARQPVTCILALRDSEREGAPADRKRIVGFAGYESTARGFFGPMGTAESERGQGVGAAVLLEALHAMRAMGYAYGIVGGVGPAEFYAKVCGATVIPDSGHSMYSDLLDREVH